MEKLYNMDPVTVLAVGIPILSYCCVSLLVIRQWADQKPISSKWIVLLVLICVFARLPSVVLNELINIDEAQTIAHALTLINSPQPWKSIDFTTNGPLNAFVFFLPSWMGLSIDYLVSHVILIVLHALLVWTLFLTVRNWEGRQSAIITLVFILAFIGFAQHPDFIHHSSETWCVVALSSAIALFSKLTIDVSSRRPLNWFWIGLLLGAVPFGKPQGAPPALLAGLFMMGYILFEEKKQLRLKSLSALTAGGLTLLFVFVVAAFSYDSFGAFYDLYVKANLHYASEHSQGLAFVPSFLWTWAAKTEVGLMFTVAAGFVSVALLTRRNAVSSADLWRLIMILAILFGGAYAVERAGRHFNHYLLLFLFPGVFLLMGWGIGRLSGQGLKRGLASFFLVGSLVLTAIHCRDHYQWLKNKLNVPEPWVVKPSALSDYVGKWIKTQDEPITVYGYYCELYVQTQSPAATRMVTAYQHASIWPELYTPYYLGDLFANRPVVFVDALDVPQDFRQSFVNSSDHRPKENSEIGEFLREHYHLAKEIEGAIVYVRKDRYSELDGIVKTE